MSGTSANLDSDGLSVSPSRIFLSKDDINSMDKQQLLASWHKQEAYINWLESQLLASQLDSDEKPKLTMTNTDLTPRENALHVRLTAKEQEIQDLLLQIQELKASQMVHSGSIHATFLDPAVNVLVQSLREELNKAKSAQEETQNELNAWKFTPDSNTGKRLMAKCRLLYQENEELGKMISSGRLAKLEGELALQKNFSEEMKKSQSELDEFLLELDEDVEGMQSTIYFLQQQLRQTREQLLSTQKEVEQLKNPGKSEKDVPTEEEKADSSSSVEHQAAAPSHSPAQETGANPSSDDSPSRATPDDNHFAKSSEAEKSTEESIECSEAQ